MLLGETLHLSWVSILLSEYNIYFGCEPVATLGTWYKLDTFLKTILSEFSQQAHIEKMIVYTFHLRCTFAV